MENADLAIENQSGMTVLRTPVLIYVKGLFCFFAQNAYCGLTEKGASVALKDRGSAMSTAYVIDEQISGPNALRVEHERYDISASWEGNVTDIVDQTRGQGVMSVFGRGFSEKLPCATRINISPIDNNISNSRLIR